MSKWPTSPFSEVFTDDTRNAVKIQQQAYLFSGQYPIIDQGKAFVSGYTDSDEGLYSAAPVIVFGDHTRAFKYVDVPFFLGADGVKLLKPMRDDIDAKYAYYFFQSAYIPNTGYNRHYKFVKELQIPLPPLPEQKRIAETLDKAQRLIDLRKKQIEEMDVLVKSQFVEVAEQCFGDGYTKPLNDFILQDRPITYGILKPGTGFLGGVPVVKVKDFPNGFIDQTDLLLTSPEIDAQYKRSRLLPCDLLISIRGTIGRLAEVPESLEGANITQDTARLSILPDIDRVYIRGALETPTLQHKMQELVRGVAVRGINIGDVRKLPIPYPDRAVQKNLAALYRQADKSKIVMQKGLCKLLAEFNALQVQAFA